MISPPSKTNTGRHSPDHSKIRIMKGTQHRDMSRQLVKSSDIDKKKLTNQGESLETYLPMFSGHGFLRTWQKDDIK